MTPRVDIVIPCYNYARYLNDCVASALDQDGADIRVLIIDDASQDDSEIVGRELARRDSRVTFVRHESNKGHIATYNEGIDWLAGDYWVLLSADDLLARGAIGRAVAVLNVHPNVGLVYGQALKTSNVAQPPPSSDDGEYMLIDGAAFIEFACERAINPVPTPSAVVRTSIQKTIGGYRADLPHSGDLEMWMRIAAHADVCALTACQAVYRWHGNNMQLGYHAPSLGDLPELRRAFDGLFSSFGHRIRGGSALHAFVRRNLGEQAFWRGSRAFDAGRTDDYKKCMTFTADCYPEFTTTRSWRLAQVKTAIGYRAWRLIKPMTDTLRRIEEEPVPSGPYGGPMHRMIGLFPEGNTKTRMERLREPADRPLDSRLNGLQPGHVYGS